MNGIKVEFENIVNENIKMVMNYVCNNLKNKFLAEDIVQEVFFRAYKAYDSYIEEGKLKGWLIRIAKNTLNNYYSKNKNEQFVSLDTFGSEDGESLYGCISNDETPEELLLRKELISDILKIVGKLPKTQQIVFNYRFIEQFSVSETAALTGIPPGSVKSKTHYAIEKIRTELGITQKNNRRTYFMTCNEAYKYLFMYAKSTLSNESKEKVERHLADCSVCSDIASALKKLVPSMTNARDDETAHFLINFPEFNLSYIGISYDVSEYLNVEEFNENLNKNNGKPDKEHFFLGGRFGKPNKLIAQFDNEGNEIGFEVFEIDTTHFGITTTFLTKVYTPVNWIYSVYIDDGSYNNVKRSKEAPNLYYGHTHNCLGCNAKSALYQAISVKAENIRIKRGNGVIDCGVYKFAYVDRYVTEEERITLDYSYLLNG
ncbi:MAG: hypothetical protein CVU97_03545 [Firmicutes bacterium HGW-Firmicutes-21]|nr:MAG: hypothetical protein CVU97_03545 [Firmicutes bacterium HGW-Firmicutes-21]